VTDKEKPLIQMPSQTDIDRYTKPASKGLITPGKEEIRTFGSQRPGSTETPRRRVKK